MRRGWLLIGLWLLGTCVWAYDLRVGYMMGVIMPDDKVEASANQPKGTWVGPLYGVDLSVGFQPDWQSLHDWNDASVGVGVQYWYLGAERLGHAVAPYGFIDVPLARTPHFQLGLRPGIGLAFVSKTYRNTVPEGHLFKDLTDSNRSIGSVTNFYFPEMLYAEWLLGKGWHLRIAAAYYHLSNGSIRQPNSGYNIFGGEIGVAKCLDVERGGLSVESGELSVERGEGKKWEVEMSVSGGARQVYYRDQQSFFAGTISTAAYWRAHPIFRLGGGVDVFYDGAYKEHETLFGKTDLTGATTKDCFRVGVSLQPEFVIGHLTAGFHAGLYLYDPVKKMEGNADKGILYAYDILKAGSAGNADGWLYTQIVLRYHLPWHLFIEAQMKAHITKVEYVSAGVGVWI